MKDRTSWIYVALAGLAGLVYAVYKYATWLPPHQSAAHMKRMSEAAKAAKEKQTKEQEENGSTKET